MFFKKPRYRQFDYEPRFYKPDQDPAERFKRKMEAQRHAHTKKRRPVLLWGVIFILAVYVYLYLSGILR